ncbi:MAG: hypothetical protein RJB66_88 [Pseudomonadota bacterium]|jgi:3-deoxy-D-manno-octulosonic-acid transferase
MLNNTKFSPHSLRFLFYHCLWKLLLFCLKPQKALLPPKVRSYLEEREVEQIVWRQSPLPQQRRIWFHAASGEIEYIKPLLRLWKQEHPDDLLFVTYFSTSARPMLQALAEVDGWAPLPYDLPDPCQRFLDCLQPSILVISRTDLWPTILNKMNAPKILVASTWAEGSKKTQGLGRWMTRWCLEYINKVGVVSEDDAEWIHRFRPHTSVAVTGDPRFDQVEFRLQQKRALPSPLTVWSQNKSVLVAGSTWTEDEQVLLPAWKKFRSLCSESELPRLLIVPHETHFSHLSDLIKLCESDNIDYCLWSQAKNQSSLINSEILIFDEKGWLAELYQLGRLAFIGGSFKKQVHSVMEALGCGLPVLVGPNYKNNREALAFAKLRHGDQYFLISVNESESLAQNFTKYWSLPEEESKDLRLRIRQEFLSRCEATRSTFKEIQKCLS